VPFSPGLHQWSKLRTEEVSPDRNDISHIQGSVTLLLNVKSRYQLEVELSVYIRSHTEFPVVVTSCVRFIAVEVSSLKASLGL
jgi:hypothetical protein